MSAGMESSSAELAFAIGASARLNRIPVTLEKIKKPISANGASFIERNKGVLRGNFIRQNLQGNDAHTYT
jgi:hypothetical protein